MTQKYSFILILFIVGSCSSRPPAEVKSKLNRLNGENYGLNPNLPVDQVGIPLIQNTRPRTTRLTGSLQLVNDSTMSPLGYRLIQLVGSQKKVVAERRTQASGEFNFQGEFSNGWYTLILRDKDYISELRFEIKTYVHENLKMLASPILQ